MIARLEERGTENVELEVSGNPQEDLIGAPAMFWI
jgi:hypothetical protein